VQATASWSINQGQNSSCLCWKWHEHTVNICASATTTSWTITWGLECLIPRLEVAQPQSQHLWICCTSFMNQI
jgi:hypothetical protein